VTEPEVSIITDKDNALCCESGGQKKKGDRGIIKDRNRHSKRLWTVSKSVTIKLLKIGKKVIERFIKAGSQKARIIWMMKRRLRKQQGETTPATHLLQKQQRGDLGQSC